LEEEERGWKGKRLKADDAGWRFGAGSLGLMGPDGRGRGEGRGLGGGKGQKAGGLGLDGLMGPNIADPGLN